MHDFFVDRFVRASEMSGFLSAIATKAKSGGGGIHGVGQTDVRGGNAVNLALALATLGAKTLLITHSDDEHLSFLQSQFRGLPAELRVKPLRAGLTVALEGRVNVMLGDGGGASRFGPSLLDRDDWRALESSRLVCSVNWAANSQGTNLLLALRRRLGSEKTIFVDPADFRDRQRQFGALLKLQRRLRLFDWLALNEHEAAAAARLLGIRGSNLQSLCRGLSLELGSRVDIHTRAVSYTSEGGRVQGRKLKVGRVRRLTGAGDVWDAASIFAKLRGMPDERRLDFANAAARIYVTRTELAPPSRDEVLAAPD
jgi:ribokinase